MIETPISFLQVDVPLSGAVLPPGRHALQGWLMPKLNGSFCDVRARAGGRLHPGILGVLRADLAQHFQTGRPQEPAGFQIQVELEAGAASIVIEALQIEGEWQPVGTLDVHVDESLPPVDIPVPSGPIRGREFGWLLRRMLVSEGAGITPAERAREILASAPYPRDLLRPTHPFIGGLNEPGAVAEAPHGRLYVEGHLFGPVSIRRVLATFDLEVWQPLTYGLPTPTIAEMHAGNPAAAACGYSGLVTVPTQLPNPVTLRIHAELPDGTRQLCQVARIWRSTADEAIRPFSREFAGRFDECIRALRRAIADRQLALVTDRTYEDEVNRLREAFSNPTSTNIAGRSVQLVVTQSGLASSESREMLRAELGAAPGQMLVAAMDASPDRAGHQCAVRAVALLWRRYPEIARKSRFALTSPDGPAADARLRSLLVELGTSAPRASSRAVAPQALADAADIVLLPGRMNYSPAVAAIFGAAGVPLLVCNNSDRAHHQDAHAGTILLPEGDPVALAEALARLLISPILRQDLADARSLAAQSAI